MIADAVARRPGRCDAGAAAARPAGAAVAGGGAALLLIAFLFDAAPLFVPAIALILIGLAAPAWVWLTARGRRGHPPPARRAGGGGGAPGGHDRGPAGPLGLPGAEVVDPFTGSRLERRGPVVAVPGGACGQGAGGDAFSPARTAHLAPPAGGQRSARAGAGGATSAAPPQQLLVLPAHRAGALARARAAPGGWRPPTAGRRRRGDGRRRPRRSAALPARHAGQPNPLAGPGPRGRADRAPPAGRRRHAAPWSCSTPAARGAGRAARRRGARGRLADAGAARAPAAAGCCCPASSAPPDRP